MTVPNMACETDRDHVSFNGDFMKLRLFGTIKESITDGPGIRYVIFAQGCPHLCPGCHNPDSHDFTGGFDVDASTILAEIVSNPLLDGVTFSGGEPFMQAQEFAWLRSEERRGGEVCRYGWSAFD